MNTNIDLGLDLTTDIDISLDLDEDITLDTSIDTKVKSIKEYEDRTAEKYDNYIKYEYQPYYNREDYKLSNNIYIKHNIYR